MEYAKIVELLDSFGNSIKSFNPFSRLTEHPKSLQSIDVVNLKLPDKSENQSKVGLSRDKQSQS